MQRFTVHEYILRNSLPKVCQFSELTISFIHKEKNSSICARGALFLPVSSNSIFFPIAGRLPSYSQPKSLGRVDRQLDRTLDIWSFAR